MSELKHVKDRVIVKIDLQEKNFHRFLDGTVIRRERQYNEFNRRITEPVNATVISAEGIPEGSIVLIHPNEVHDSNKIFNYQPLSGDETASTIKYYSVNEYQCFIWREQRSSKWMPLKNFATGLRLFEPYKGLVHGIKPLEIKNVLYITSGEFEGMVVHTVRAADYCIIFQDVTQREGQIIRIRHYENERHDREEIIAIDYTLTEKVKDGKILIGLSTSDCQTLNQYQCQQLTTCYPQKETPLLQSLR